MTITMNTTHLPTLKQMAGFVSGCQAIQWQTQDSSEAYTYVQRVLKRYDRSHARG